LTGSNPLAGEIEDGVITPGEIKATPAEIGDNMPRPSLLRRIGATLLAASSMPDELAEERAAERVVVDVAVHSSHEVAQAGVVDSRDEVSEAVAGKRKKETAAAAFVSQEKEEEPLKKKPKPAGALGVASEDSDIQVEEMEAQFWKKLDTLKAHVDAWQSFNMMLWMPHRARSKQQQQHHCRLWRRSCEEEAKEHLTPTP